MKRVAISISKDGRKVAITVLSDIHEPQGLILEDITQLTLIDRRQGNTAILSGDHSDRFNAPRTRHK
jgi:hypothetical protein